MCKCRGSWLCWALGWCIQRVWGWWCIFGKWGLCIWIRWGWWCKGWRCWGCWRYQEKGHANARWKGQVRWRDIVEQAHGCHHTTIYPSYIPDALPLETDIVIVTLEQCTTHHKKLRDDLARLELPTESRQSLQILLESLGKFISAYRSISPTTYCFIHLMWMQKD